MQSMPAARAGDDRLHLRVVVDLELLFGQLLGADVAGEVGDAEDEPGHARRRRRDLVGLQARLGGLDEHLELDAPDLEAHVLLDLRQQAIGEAHVVGAVALRQHHDVDVRAGRLDHLDDVLVEELGADVVGANARILPLKSSVLNASTSVLRASTFCETAHESSESRITSSASEPAALVIIFSECAGQVARCGECGSRGR